MGFFGFVSTLGISGSKDFSSSFRIFTRFPTGSMPSPMGTVSRFRVVIGLTSDTLCQIRLKILLGISHTVGFFRLHFPVQVEIENVVFEDRLE